MNFISSQKNQFDSLSKEELITKCKSFLVIAKKAKASKDGEKSESEVGRWIHEKFISRCSRGDKKSKNKASRM
jgi:hypothetical protein